MVVDRSNYKSDTMRSIVNIPLYCSVILIKATGRSAPPLTLGDKMQLVT